MSTSTINFDNVIMYSKKYCVLKSLGKCAQYVKNAFKEGGCTYVSGNGWNNQKFCETNGFKCIGDFVPIDNNPRAHGSLSIQFPSGYVQQIGDICLIKHGVYGHICYATGSGINDWVSDYWQKSPGQQNGTGPYCYTDSIKRVQFWRHSSVMNGAPVVSTTTLDAAISATSDNSMTSSYSSSRRNGTSLSNVQKISSMGGQDDGNPGSTILGFHIRQKR